MCILQLFQKLHDLLLNGQKPEKKETATSSILVTRENMYDDKSQKALFSFEEK